MQELKHNLSLLSNLRNYLSKNQFDGMLMVKADPHQTEYTLDRDNVIKLFTGFAGSVACCIVANSPCQNSDRSAVIFTDGRYTEQLTKQTDSNTFAYSTISVDNICAWILQNFNAGSKLAFDAAIFPYQLFKNIEAKLQGHKILLCPLPATFLDNIWLTRGQIATPAIVEHKIEYSGLNMSNKLSLVRAKIIDHGADSAFLNVPEDIAWLFNIRSPQNPNTPAALIYAYVPKEGACRLFIHPHQHTDELINYLDKRVELDEYNNAFNFLKRVVINGEKIYLDPNSVTIKTVNLINSAKGEIVFSDNLCMNFRAVKNFTEINGARSAHLKDGVAVSNLLAWLENSISAKTITERDVEAKIIEFRLEQDLYITNSFNTISSTGPNGSIIHYSSTTQTNRIIQDKDIFLLDCGGQYLDGTTDVTRNIVINAEPTIEQKDRYTRILKGHIALANLIFPEGTSGQQIDAIARQYLWQAGCDYNHGTGHGVGSYLSCHEGPQSISFANHINKKAPLKAGMILSNEPGYYKSGEYGMRIENLMLVTAANQELCHERTMLCFETLTLVPIVKKLININLLENCEIKWLNVYHQKIYSALSSLIKQEYLEWLTQATMAITKNDMTV